MISHGYQIKGRKFKKDLGLPSFAQGTNKNRHKLEQRCG